MLVFSHYIFPIWGCGRWRWCYIIQTYLRGKNGVHGKTNKFGQDVEYQNKTVVMAYHRWMVIVYDGTNLCLKFLVHWFYVFDTRKLLIVYFYASIFWWLPSSIVGFLGVPPLFPPWRKFVLACSWYTAAAFGLTVRNIPHGNAFNFWSYVHILILDVSVCNCYITSTRIRTSIGVWETSTAPTRVELGYDWSQFSRRYGRLVRVAGKDEGWAPGMRDACA